MLANLGRAIMRAGNAIASRRLVAGVGYHGGGGGHGGHGGHGGGWGHGGGHGHGHGGFGFRRGGWGTRVIAVPVGCTAWSDLLPPGQYPAALATLALTTQPVSLRGADGNLYLASRSATGALLVRRCLATGVAGAKQGVGQDMMERPRRGTGATAIERPQRGMGVTAIERPHASPYPDSVSPHRIRPALLSTMAKVQGMGWTGPGDEAPSEQGLGATIPWGGGGGGGGTIGPWIHPSACSWGTVNSADNVRLAQPDQANAILAWYNGILARRSPYSSQRWFNGILWRAVLPPTDTPNPYYGLTYCVPGSDGRPQPPAPTHPGSPWNWNYGHNALFGTPTMALGQIMVGRGDPFVAFGGPMVLPRARALRRFLGQAPPYPLQNNVGIVDPSLVSQVCSGAFTNAVWTNMTNQAWALIHAGVPNGSYYFVRLDLDASGNPYSKELWRIDKSGGDATTHRCSNFNGPALDAILEAPPAGTPGPSPSPAPTPTPTPAPTPSPAPAAASHWPMIAVAGAGVALALGVAYLATRPPRTAAQLAHEMGR